NVRHLQQALDRAVFAEWTIKDRENYVELLRGARTAVAIKRKQSGVRRVAKNGDGVACAFGQLSRQSRLSIRTQQLERFRRRLPLPFPGNRNRHHLVFRSINRFYYRSCRSYRHFMFARPAAKNYPHPELLRQISTPNLNLKNRLTQSREDQLDSKFRGFVVDVERCVYFYDLQRP